MEQQALIGPFYPHSSLARLLPFYSRFPYSLVCLLKVSICQNPEELYIGEKNQAGVGLGWRWLLPFKRQGFRGEGTEREGTPTTSLVENLNHFNSVTTALCK